MSSIVDRQPERAGSFLSHRSGSRAELFFWMALTLFGAALVASAIAGASYANSQVSSETFLVGP
jgi:hypothetical protein